MTVFAQQQFAVFTGELVTKFWLKCCTVSFLWPAESQINNENRFQQKQSINWPSLAEEGVIVSSSVKIN